MQIINGMNRISSSLLKFSFVAMVGMITFSACAQKEEISTKAVEKEKTTNYDKPHPYGGWYCPDNLNGFPPVNVQNLDEVPVVIGRLPTKEEARSGNSLIYVDTEKYKDARPMDIDLPRLARVYTSHNGMDELVVVIQAVIIKQDTIVGYRFVNGGNGSARIGQVEFLSDGETYKLKEAPFVHLKTSMKGNKTQIWEALKATDYFQSLSNKFNEKKLMNIKWSEDHRFHLEYELEGERGSGIVMNLYGNLYVQMDYDLDGFHYSEKILVLENSEGQADVHLVAGPFSTGFEKSEIKWKKLAEEIESNLKNQKSD